MSDPGFLAATQRRHRLKRLSLTQLGQNLRHFLPMQVRRSAACTAAALLIGSSLGAWAQSSVTVGSNAQMTVTLNPVASGTFDPLEVLTSGSPNLDFTYISDNCGSSLAVGVPCNVIINFAPLYPGVRQGAVVAKSGKQLLASTPVYGIGLGSLPVLVPGTINTAAGTTSWRYTGDGGQATQSPIWFPLGLAVDGAGNLFLCDSGNNRIRRVDAVSQVITTVAGDGTAGGAGDGGIAKEAEINTPSGIAIDGAGNLYIADTGNNAVRRVDAVSNLITTVAGQIGTTGSSGDNGPATSALLAGPLAVALTPAGDLVIADSGNNEIREVTLATGTINTVAGTGTAGYGGDGGLATAAGAKLNDPSGVAVRTDGAIAIADTNNQRIRLVGTTGILSTVAGTGVSGFSGNNGLPTNAELSSPAGVSFDPAGDLFIADSVNERVRVIVASTPATIQTLVGNGGEGSGATAFDGGPANNAELFNPSALVVDAVGNVWIADTFYMTVRKVSSDALNLSNTTTPGLPVLKVGSVSPPFPEVMYNEGNAALVLGAPVLSQAALDAPTTTCVNSLTIAPSNTCRMGIEFAPTVVGPSITGTIKWPSNAQLPANTPFVLPEDFLTGQVLSVNPTTLQLVASPNPGTLGQPVTLTATIPSPPAGITGTVTFSYGATTLCSAKTLGANGVTTCATSTLPLGTDSLTASYSGDTNNAASTAPAYPEIIEQHPTLTLAASANPAIVSSTVIFTLTANPNTATGTVTLYDGTTSLGQTSFSSGSAQWSISSLAVGTHTISAQYAGDSADFSGTSSSIMEVVTKANTTTTVSSNTNPATVGTSVTLTASVASTGGPIPTGTVNFTSNSVSLGSGTLSGGVATLMTTALVVGNDSIVATYVGDGNSTTSKSSAITETITAIGTSTTLTTSANPVYAGATLMLTATVTPSQNVEAAGALTGTVTFKDGANTLGTANINGSGVATLSIPTATAGKLPVGANSLTAVYAGIPNYTTSSSTAFNETVLQAPTTTTLSSSKATSLSGQSVTFTATVTIASGTPSGTVNFYNGATLLAGSPVTLNGSGVATLTTTALPKGTDQITATFAANVNYGTSTSSPAVQVVVSLASATLGLTGPTAVDAGNTEQYTETLTTTGVAPTGTVKLLNGNTTIGSVTVTEDGSFSFPPTTLGIGTYTITAHYSGDPNNSSADSSPITLMVKQAPSTTTLQANPNPVTVGALLTLSATVGSDSPNVGGQVSFYNGATLLGTAALGTNGSATYSTSTLSAGTHALKAVYAGETNHAGSSSATLNETVVQPTTATLTSSKNPAESGQSVTFTAQMGGPSGGSGNAIPTGTATFRDNGALLATVTLNAAGAAAFTTTTLAVGSHPITVSYSGDSVYSTATAQLLETVNNASTVVTLAASANPATYKQPVSLTATVVSAGGTATGTVTFTDGGVNIGSAQLNASAVAVLTLSTLAPGTHTVVASYTGNGQADASTSAPLTLVVKQTTTLAVTANTNPALTLASVTFTATIANAGGVVAIGNVVFTDNGSAIGTATIGSTGIASLTLPKMTAGTHDIVASYAGDGSNFASTSGTYTETIQLRPTTTSVTGTLSGPDNTQVTLIAVVIGQGPVPPGGTVTFTNGSASLGQATVGPTGVATLQVNASQLTNSVVASYSGDVNYAPSQSPSTTITAAGGEQFILGATPAAVTVVTHQHTTMTINITSVKGFTDTISLGCTGLPYAATCSFQPSQVKLGNGGTETASLILDTGNPLGAGSSAKASLMTRSGTYLAFLPLGLLVGLLRSKRTRAARRSLGILCAAGFAILLSMGISGCGGLTISGTPPGTYKMQVVAYGQTSNVTETQDVTLVVTQ